MFEKYHRMAYSGRKITFWTPLHSEWYIHGLTSRFFCASTFDLRVHFKGSPRRTKQQIYQPKILYKVIITKDRVNGVCGIACTYIQEAKKVSKFYNITCYCSQIRAFVWSKTNLPKSGRLWTCFSIRYRLIPQKQVFEFWGLSVSFKDLCSSSQDPSIQFVRVYTHAWQKGSRVKSNDWSKVIFFKFNILISYHVFRLTPITKIMPFLESLKKELYKNV